MHGTIELLETVFSLRYVPRIYNEEQLRLREGLEMAIRRVGGSCEMAASLGCEKTEDFEPIDSKHSSNIRK
jgi:hypothetical protein